MGRRDKCAFRTVMGLIIAGCACGMLMRYFLGEFEDAAEETEIETANETASVESAIATGSEEVSDAEKQETTDTQAAEIKGSKESEKADASVAVITESEESAAVTADAGNYVVKKTDTGFVFNLIAANGETIAVSEVYNTKKSCLNGINSVMTNAPAANVEDQTVEGFEKCKNPKFEVYTDKAGEFRFRLKAKNGQIIATGKGYKEKKSCLDGVESIRRNAEAEIK